MLAKRLDLTFSYLNSAVRRFFKFPPRTVSAVLVYTRNFAGSESPIYDNSELGLKAYCRPTLQATYILNFVRQLTPLLFRITVPWDAATRTFDLYPNSCQSLDQNRTRYSTQQPRMTFVGYSVMGNTAAFPIERLGTRKLAGLIPRI